ncbi:hypothetical protein MBAV_000350 [Candidatus Magnetobacterium bavaricum]|uniref:Uncharacterized protein n=1 Tax=Candidatus Magnetobacterium bavaricum TaxID=29290 RepID=A0A0F3GZX6_9BACT|nr:hypothetical protein MBAV_000350 [Candidatus Magnetobacterium bavaricum]
MKKGNRIMAVVLVYPDREYPEGWQDVWGKCYVRFFTAFGVAVRGKYLDEVFPLFQLNGEL